MQRALIFPGQGGQVVGMGQALDATFPEARAVFQEVNDALGEKLTDLMFNGPEEKLNLAENARLAIFSVSVAVARVLEKQRGVPLSNIADCIAGHSLGEYSALCAAGTFPLAETAKFLRQNSRDIQQAVPVGVGAMGVLLGVNKSQAQEIASAASQGEICAIANDNGPKQVVVSGHSGAVGRAVDLVAKRYQGSGMLLPVSIPGHSPLLAGFEPGMQDSLMALYKQAPVLPWISNATANIVRNGRVIIPKLVAWQISRPVRWHESVLFMKVQGVNHYIECGNGKLSGLVHYIDPGAALSALSEPKGIDQFLQGRVVSRPELPIRKKLPDQLPGAT